jgi:large subunit ribosomal protein L7A
VALADLRDPRRRVVGTRETLKRIARGRVKVVYLAQDADPAVVAPVVARCRERSVAVEYVPTMQALGQACGIDVGAACAAELEGGAGA